MNTYKIGQRFDCYYEGELWDTFILAQTESYKVALINLSNGNRWVDPIKVENQRHITQKELDKICDPGENNYIFILSES